MSIATRSMPVFEEGTVKIDVSTRKHPNVWAIIDEQDWDKVKAYRWSATKRKKAFYVRSHSVGLLHRFILNASDEFVVDHMNGDTLDNRRGNLRECTYFVNNQSAKDRMRGYGIITERISLQTSPHVVKKVLADGTIKEYTYPTRSKNGTKTKTIRKICNIR